LATATPFCWPTTAWCRSARIFATAFAVAEEIEFVAQIYYQTLIAGDPKILTEAQMSEVLKKFKTYGPIETVISLEPGRCLSAPGAGVFKGPLSSPVCFTPELHSIRHRYQVF
jgi:hypothetical protein